MHANRRYDLELSKGSNSIYPLPPCKGIRENIYSNWRKDILEVQKSPDILEHFIT